MVNMGQHISFSDVIFVAARLVAWKIHNRENQKENLSQVNFTC